MLIVDDIKVRYEQVPALFGISFEVQSGEAVAILGTNGAGKSTLASTLSGLVPSCGGSVIFDGHDVTKMAPHAVRSLGLCYVPEGRGIFPTLSVHDNLRMAVRILPRAERKSAIDAALNHFGVLGARLNLQASSLSGGEQQMLALVRAIAVRPRLIIADELSLGLAPKVIDDIFDSLEQVRKEGVSILLIEQYVHRALAFADRYLVLQRGKVAFGGDTAAANEEILDQYLGTAVEDG